MRQTVGGEIGEAFGTIKGIVDSAATPPLGFQDVDGVKLLGIHNTGDDAFLRRSSLMMMVMMTWKTSMRVGQALRKKASIALDELD